MSEILKHLIPQYCIQYSESKMESLHILTLSIEKKSSIKQHKNDCKKMCQNIKRNIRDARREGVNKIVLFKNQSQNISPKAKH